MPHASPADTMPPLDEHQLAALVARHADHARLCTRLEAIADRLPHRPAAAEAQTLCDALVRYQSDLEAASPALEQALQSISPRQPVARAVLAHIEQRRAATVGTAADLVGALSPPHLDGTRLCSEAMGFLIRGFFEACRHTLAIEEIAILLVTDSRLSPAARMLLESRLAIMR